MIILYVAGTILVGKHTAVNSSETSPIELMISGIKQAKQTVCQTALSIVEEITERGKSRMPRVGCDFQ